MLHGWGFRGFGPGMMWGYGSGGFGGLTGNQLFWFGIAKMALSVIFWVALIVIGVKLFRKYNSSRHQTLSTQDYALNILRERYARGEINTEEYLQRKEALVGNVRHNC